MRGYVQFRCAKCGRIFLVKEIDYIKGKPRLNCPYDKHQRLIYVDPYKGIKECMMHPHNICIEE